MIAPGLKRRGGLFGASMPNAPRLAENPPMAAEEQPMQRQPGFFGEGGVGRAIAGNIGDFLLQYSGMQPIYQPQMHYQRQLQAQAQRDAANRALDNADFYAREQWKRDNPEQKTDIFDDNAGNRWRTGADGKPQLIFRDPNQKRIPQKVYGPNGEEYIEYIEIPNMVNEDGSFRQGGGASVVAPDTLPPDFDGFDDGGAPPIGASPPRTNTVSRSAYQAWVTQYGKAETDAMMKRNGMILGNY